MEDNIYLVTDLLLNNEEVDVFLKLRLTNKHLYNTFNIAYTSKMLGIREITLKGIIEVYDIKKCYERHEGWDLICMCAKYDRYEYINDMLKVITKKGIDIDFILESWYEKLIKLHANKAFKYLLSLKSYLLSNDSYYDNIICCCLNNNNVGALQLLISVYKLDTGNDQWLYYKFDQCGGEKIYDYLISLNIYPTFEDVAMIAAGGDIKQLDYITENMNDKVKEQFLTEAFSRISDDEGYFMKLLDKIGQYLDIYIFLRITPSTPMNVVKKMLSYMDESEIDRAQEYLVRSGRHAEMTLITLSMMSK